MAWPSPFRTTTAQTRSCWGYTFEWTDDHLDLEEAETLKQSYDVLGEECLAILEQHRSPKPPSDAAATTKRASGRDFYQLLCHHHADDPILDKLWKQLNTVPDWVDWDQIRRGQDVFYRYAGPNLTGLAYQALLGGMGARRVVEVLARTGGFSTATARRRLFETTQYVLQCTRSVDAIQPGGEGFAATVRVRLLHAAVRRRIMSLADKRPGYFDAQAWGVPINDLDSIATISSFSATLLWMSLPRQGIFPTRRETEDYVALWRYVGYLMGCPVEPYFESPRQAKAMMESLLVREIDPSDTSKVLANNIIKSLDDQPPGYASADFLIAGARWLNGNELGDRLGLPRPSAYYWALFAGQNLFFCAFCYINRLFPELEARKIVMFKETFYKLIVESKWALGGQETLFEFKYVPEYDTVTELNSESKPRMRGIETRALKSLVIGVLSLAGTAYALWKAVSVTLSGLRWATNVFLT